MASFNGSSRRRACRPVSIGQHRFQRNATLRDKRNRSVRCGAASFAAHWLEPTRCQRDSQRTQRVVSRIGGRTAGRRDARGVFPLTITSIYRTTLVRLSVFLWLATACSGSEPCSGTDTTTSKLAGGKAEKRPRIPVRVLNSTELQLRLAQDPRDGSSLRVTFRNTSEVSLWINYRGYSDLKEDRGRGIWLEVTREDGTPIQAPDCRGDRRTRLPEEYQYVRLAPAAEFTFPVRLGCNAPAENAVLRVTAYYQDVREDIPIPADGSHWFSGKAVSNLVVMHYESWASDASATPTAGPTQVVDPLAPAPAASASPK
jgi:hypothetical protein